jgi:uncharacterized membrane protein
MHARLSIFTGAIIGAVTAYYFDPERGRRRRAITRDKVVHAGHKAYDGIGVAARDIRNRAAGTVATMRSALDFQQPSDDVLAERIRAQIGRVVSHPGSIDIAVHDGIATLSGPILADEVPLLIDCTFGVRGVKNVQNQLEIHSEPGNVPGLQGEPSRELGKPSAFNREDWPPAARAIGGAAGLIAAYYGFSRRNPLAWAIGIAGLALIGRAAANVEVRALVGAPSARQGFRVEKTIHIQAPVEKVFQLWENFENFPRFMMHVKSVQPLAGEGQNKRWRWTVQEFGGIEFEFDSIVTAREPNRLLTWCTEPGSMIRHAGRVLFQGQDDGSTVVNVQMAYLPVAGAVGHAIARLLGADPKQQMDEDLIRMKTYIETGIPPRDAAAQQAPGQPGQPTGGRSVH